MACKNGCIVDPDTVRCRICGASLDDIFHVYMVPEKDQQYIRDEIRAHRDSGRDFIPLS